MNLEDVKKVSNKLVVKRVKQPTQITDSLIADTKKIDESKNKKSVSKKDKLEEEFQAMIHYDEIQVDPEEPKETRKKSEDEWDVKIGDPITFFDPELSYELTGYRPITATQGLDFDPKPFTEAARNYKRNQRYTQLLPGTFAHRAHWQQEFNRCKNGVTIGKYRLTGENYFWLNYYRIPSVLDRSGAELQEESFPTFIAKQYEYFHYLELCRKVGMDGIAFKSRGVGASEIAASNCAHAYTFHRATRNIVTAFADTYVTTTLAKVWQELDFLNTCTEGAFRRVRMKIDTNMKKKASKVDADKNETGWMSIIEGCVADEPRKLRGARTFSLFFEEAGSNPKLVDTYIQSRALVVINGYRVGNRFVFGTAGDSGPNLAGLKDMFYNPEEYFMLPYHHKYTQSGEGTFTGYFIPSYTMWFGTPDNPGFDERGVVDEARAKAYYQAEWAKIKDPSKLMKDKAEYCFTPEDAFILEGDNHFDQEKLVEQLQAIELHKTVEKPRCIRLSWGLKDGEVDRDSKPKCEFVEQSKIQITELPMEDQNGLAYANLYVGGIDAIDVDSTTSTGQTDVSEFCFVIMRRQIGLKSPKVVAIYKERPAHIQTAFDTAIKLCQFYNCKALVEATRISIKQYFERFHKLEYLMHRPKASANTSQRTNFKQFGVPATGAIIEHQLDLIEQYIVDYCEQIQFPNLLDELMRYSYENKRKFDIVAAFGICLLADEEMLGKVARTSANGGKKLNIGYGRNEFGQSVFGNRVPQTEVSYDMSTQRVRFRFN